MKQNLNMTLEEYRAAIANGDLKGFGNCPVTILLSMLQGKWKLIVLYQLVLNGTMRFGELKKMVPGITNTMLSTILRELEADGFLTRTQYNEIPPHVEYALTPKGQDLDRIFYEMFQWTVKHVKCDKCPKT